MGVIELTLLSPCVSVREYRGNAQRARGLEYKEEPPDSAFIGRRRRKGDGGKRARTVRAKRVPQTPTATVATSQKPDNRGGASWFVLLAAEKNEQTKCISCIRDYLWRGKKIISIQPSPPAVPRSIAGCGARKYRGELRSVATRRGVKNTRSESNRGKPPLPLCRATI